MNASPATEADRSQGAKSRAAQVGREHANTRRRPARYWVSAIVRHGVLLLVAAACAVPFLYSVVSSFKTSSEIIAVPPTFFPNSWSLESYRQLFTSAHFGRYALNTTIYAGISTVVAIVSSSAAAYVFAKYRFQFKSALFGILLATVMVPIGAVLVPLYLTVSRLGWVSTYQGVIVPTTITTFGIFLMRQFIAAIPDELIEAARIDRASETRIFVSVILPLAIPALVILGVLHFLAQWDAFLWPLTVINDDSLNNLSLATASLAAEHGPRYDLQLAASVVTNVPVILIYIFVQRQITRGIAMTGGKL